MVLNSSDDQDTYCIKFSNDFGEAYRFAPTSKVLMIVLPFSKSFEKEPSESCLIVNPTNASLNPGGLDFQIVVN